LLKNTFFSAINILGLAFGLTCTLLILLWVYDELQYDQFHEANVCQILGALKSDEGRLTPYAPSAMAQPIRDNFQEVEHIARVFPIEVSFQEGDQKFSESGLYADPSFLTIFNFPLKEGRLQNILEAPNEVVISSRLAAKYFPGQSALGKTIGITQSKDLKQQYVVVGVLKPIPKQSSMQFDFILDYGRFESQFRPWWQPENSGGAYTNFNVAMYASLSKHTNLTAFNDKLGAFIRKFTNRDIQDGLYAYPFGKRYLHADYSQGKEATGRIRYIHILLVVAMTILVIACVNFMNLSTATATKRAKEVGLRKAIGASRAQLIVQFIMESVLIAILAMAVAITLAHMLLPIFNYIVQKQIEIPFTNLNFLGVTILISIVTGIIAGCYPALFLSAYSPAKTLKGTGSTAGGSGIMRKALVIFQFSLSIIFIIYTLIVYSQINFIKDKDLGIKKDNIIYHELHGIAGKTEAYKSELLQIPGVEAVTFTEHNPLYTANGNRFVSWKGKSEDALIYFNVMQVGADILKTFDLKLVEGSGFTPNYSKEGERQFIINEAAARAMQVSDPVGMRLTVWGREGAVVGVVKDFNHQSLMKSIEPVVMIYNPVEVWKAFISINTTDVAGLLEKAQNVYEKYEPNYAFDYSFVSDDLDAGYRELTVSGRLNYIFAMVAILISCIGLFGLSAFVAQQRTKETGIRKVLGASSWGLLRLFTYDFVKLVVVAFVIAAPISWFYADRWLSEFAYHIQIGVLPFVLAGLSAFAIAIFTVSYTTLKVTSANPVDSLKYE